MELSVNRIINEYDPSLKSSRSMGMVSVPCPTAKALEDMYHPDIFDICKMVYKMVKEIAC